MSETLAVQAVLQVAELLEIIISQLSCRDVLCAASRVSPTWAQIITTSPSIRKKLFRRTSKSSPVSPSRFHGHWLVEEPCQPVYDETLEINPLIDNEQPCYKIPSLRRFPRGLIRLRFNVGCDVVPYVSTSEGKQKSWRDMFLIDPPCTILMIEASMFPKKSDDECEHTINTFTIRDRKGITLGFLADVLADVCLEPSCEVMSRVAFRGGIYDELTSER